MNHPPDLLLIAHIDLILEFLFRAAISIHAFRYENGLYRRVSEYHACGEEAVYDGEENLYYKVLAHISNSVCNPSVHTHSFPPWHLECAYRRFLARRFSPRSSYWVEAHLAMPRVRAGFATPWLDLLVRCDALY